MDEKVWVIRDDYAQQTMGVIRAKTEEAALEAAELTWTEHKGEFYAIEVDLIDARAL